MRTVGRISAAALVAVGLLVAGFLVLTRFAAIHPSAAAAAMVATAYSTGSPPTMCAPPGQMALASGLGLDDSCVSDEDLDPNNAPVDDDADIDCVTVIDACGNATPLCDDWQSWSPTDPGVYLMLVTLDDAANYADDPPVTYQFTFEVGDEATGKSGINTTYAYDAIGRQTHVTDGRGSTTQTSYDASGRVAWVKDGAQNQTDYGYYVGSDSGTGVYPGRLKYVENPADKRNYFGYNDHGQTIRTWGHVPNPTESVYDGYGQRTTLKTFRGGSGWDGSTWPGSPGDSDDTSWTFHEATGLLNQKTYDDSTSIVYTYTSDGKLYTRKWARNASDGKVTTYTYDADTGELTDVEYDAAWSMTDLAYTYDRLGRRKTVTDAAGVRTFVYDADTLQPTTETFSSGLFSGKIITQVYQDGTGGTLAGRWAGVQVGTSGDPDANYAASYGFDTYGRLNHVTGPGLPTGDGTNNGAWYGFVSGSELVDQLLFKNSSATVKGWVDWSYEDDRDLVTAVENGFGDLSTYTTISKYAYGNDSRGRREHVVRTGSAFASSHMDLWQYNDRNELTRSERHAGADPNSPGTEDTSLRRVYAYDPIGNRNTSTEGTGAQTTYTSNNLNQYDPVVTATSPQTGQRLKYDLDGNLTEAYVTGDINGDGNVDMSDLGALLAAYGTCEGQQGYNPNANISPNDPGPQCVDMADLGLLLSVYGLQATGAIRAKFTWDAENRLVGWEPLLFVSGAKKVEFKYDYFGRRIEKKVYTYNGSSWDLSETRRFIWNDWLLLLELDADGNVVRKLTWGRDLSGSLDGAGGIGGLLSIQDTNGTPSSDTDDLRYVYFYDANGNVGQVIDLAASSASASMKAHYEYDAYGNVLVQSGSYAAANPYRFSTKPWDDETALGYWGQRYYDPRLGRWINHDPIGELGGLNLYAYVANSPTMWVDPVGNEIECDWGNVVRCLMIRCFPIIQTTGGFCQQAFDLCMAFPDPRNPGCIALAGCAVVWGGCAASCVVENCRYVPPPATVDCWNTGKKMNTDIHGTAITGCTCYYQCSDGRNREFPGELRYRMIRGEAVPVDCECTPRMTLTLSSAGPAPPSGCPASASLGFY